MEYIRLDELITEHGRDYLFDRYPELAPYCMESLDELFTPLRAVELAFHGCRYGQPDEPFCPYDGYFVADTTLQSLEFVDDYVLDVFENLDKDEFIAWCRENEYLYEGLEVEAEA